MAKSAAIKMKLVALLISLASCDGASSEAPADLTPLVDCKLAPESSNSPIIALDKVPRHIPAAFLAAEDRQFYERQDLSGSTIVHQVVKLMPAIAQRCTGQKSDLAQQLSDKHRRQEMESTLVARLDRELTKPQILSIYLNHVYLGHGAYGVAGAAKTYFGKDLERVTIAEAALLAGLVVSPTNYAPHRNLALARDRRDDVLGKMRDGNRISELQYRASLTEPITLVVESDQPR